MEPVLINAHLTDSCFLFDALFPSRNTLAELFPSKQLPTFPVNVLPNSGSLVRDTSPTKPLYGSSPTNSLTMTTVGRRSPNLDNQMDAIAEDYTEDLATPTVTPTETIPPTALVSAGGDVRVLSNLRSNDPGYSRHGRTSLGANEPIFQRPGRTSLGSNETAFQRTGRTSLGGNEPSVFQRSGLTSLSGNESLVYPRPAQTGMDSNEPPPTYQRPVTPGSEKKQRRTGASMLQSSVPPAKNGLHQLLMAGSNHTKTAPPANNLLLGMLQSPLSTPQPTQQQEQPLNHPLINSEFINQQSSNPTNTYHTQQQQQSHNLLGMAALVQIQQLANHVSTVLNSFGLHHVHQNNVFTVDHRGVRFQIHVAGNIQLQYVAGDMTQYQSLCSQLYSSLVPTTQ